MKLIVLTIPRSGTHMITRSIANTLQIPYAVPVLLIWRHDKRINIPIENDWVMGAHFMHQNEYVDNVINFFKKENIQVVCFERHPLDNLLALMAFGKSQSLPNDETLLEDLVMHTFKYELDNMKEWKINFPSFSYDKLIAQGTVEYDEEITRFSKLIGKTLLIEPVTKTIVEAPWYHHGSSAQSGLWKKVFTQESIDRICVFLELDSSLFTSSLTNKTMGNNKYLNTYQKLLTADY
jgi:hypothetical protein